MTVPAMAAAGNRIGEIQSRFQRNTRVAGGFAESLRVAQADAAADGVSSGNAVYTVKATATPSTTAADLVPVGILGTPIVRNGAFVTSPVSGSWTGRLPASAGKFVDTIESAAAHAGLDPRLLAAMVWQESGFDPAAISSSGAIGLSQLMPATAEGLGVDPWNTTENLDGGARYLAWAIEEFGSIELGLAAYNAGPTRVREAGGIPEIPETRAYVPRVLDYYRQLGGVA